jgi:hypothetical protein
MDNAIIRALRERAARFTSLDSPQGGDVVDVAADVGAGFVPVVGTALSARDFERARREGDRLGMGLAAAGMLPVVGGVARAAGKARKGTRAAEATAEALRKAPQDEALRTAQENAVRMLGLPPGNTPMDRARAMGFSDADIYHATTKDFPAFDLSKAGSGATVSKTERAVFTSKKPAVSEEYVAGPYYNNNGEVARQFLAGANVMPLRVRLTNPQGWEMSGGSYDPAFVQQALKDARKAKADSVIFKNMRDPSVTTVGRGDPSTIVATLQPQMLRSRFAAFDPARINENDIMGYATPAMLGTLALGSAGAMGAVAALRQRDEDKDKKGK